MLREKGFYKGINLGGWMSQCDYSEDRLNNFIREDDFGRIAGWGLDHVRLPVDYNVVQRTDGSLIPAGFERIDRALEWAGRYGLRIVLDLHKTQGFSFVQSWNNYFIPALLLDKAEMKTVPIMIAQLRSADYSKFDMGKVYMFILLAILPVLIVYLLLSRFIIRGVTAGAVKG